MGISEDDGYFVCDFCGEDTGKFNSETGNHWVCEEKHNLILRIKSIIQDARLALKQTTPYTDRELFETCLSLIEELI